MRTGKVLTAVLLFLLLTGIFTGACSAHSNPFSKNTEVYYELSLTLGKVQNIFIDSFQRLKEIEAIEPVFSKISLTTGINIEDDIFSWIGNRISIGVVGIDRPVIRSQIAENIRYGRSVAQLKRTVHDIRQIRSAVESYQIKNKKLPESIENIVSSKVRPPRGGYYRYRMLGQGRYEITAPDGQFNDLGLKGEQPAYNNLRGFSGDVPVVKKPSFKLKNILFAADVKDRARAAAFITKLEGLVCENPKKPGVTRHGYGKYVIRQTKEFSVMLTEDMLLISDNPNLLRHAADIIMHPEMSITNSKAYQLFIADTNDRGIRREVLFINLDRLNIDAAMLEIKEPILAELFNSLYYIGYSGFEEERALAANFFLRIRPGCRLAILDRYFNSPQRFKEELLGRLPSELPMAAAINAGEAWELFRAVASVNAELKQGEDMADMAFKSFSGMSADKYINDTLTGEIAVTYKVRDALLSVLSELISNRKCTACGIPGKCEAPDKNEDETAANVPVKHQAKEMMPPFPMTFFVGIKNADNVNLLLNKLNSEMTPSIAHYKGVKIFSTNYISYFMLPDMLVIHTTPSTTALKKYVDNLTAPGSKRLGQVTKYEDFRQGIKGRVLTIQYNNVKWASDIVEGLTALFIPEFKEYADMFGNFDEAWSSISIVPEGIQMHLKYYKD